MSFVFAISILLLLVLITVFFARGVFVALILVPASQFLGFIDPMSIAVKGKFDVHALIAIFIVIAVLSSRSRWADLRNAAFLKPILILGILWIYGVIYPVMKGYSSLFYALKGSKEFITIFSYLAVFLYLRTEKEVRLGWYLLVGLGIYYSVVEMLVQVAGSALLSNMVYAFRKEMFFWKIYPPFWPVILVALFHAYYELMLGSRSSFVRISIASVGLLLTFFRSYLLATFAAVPLLMWVGRLGVIRTVLQGLIISFVITFSIIGIAVIASDSHDSISRLSEHFVFSGIEEFSTQSGGALAGREVIAKERRRILEENPYTGFGFIDKDSTFGRRVQFQIDGDLLGVIDKGDLDVALKFGYVGRTILYGTALYLVLILIRLVRSRINKSVSAGALTAATLIVVFLIVQPVHAALTYSFSLLPLGIVLGLLDRERLLALRAKEHRT